MSILFSKVEIYSRNELELLIKTSKPSNAAIISFFDPPSNRTPKYYTHIDFSSCNIPVFLVGVHDIDIDILDEYGLTFESYFPEADEIAEFIFNANDKGLDIICQCEYGQSRSPGCSAAILEYFTGNGISIFADYRYYPNRLIFNKMLAALRKFAGN